MSRSATIPLERIDLGIDALPPAAIDLLVREIGDAARILARTMVAWRGFDDAR